MAPPRVEVGGVRVPVGGVWRAVEMEEELVGGEEVVAIATLDAFGPGAVVAGRHEAANTTPPARVAHVEDEVGRKSQRLRVLDERLDEAFCLSPRDDAAAPRGRRRRSGSSQHLQLSEER